MCLYSIELKPYAGVFYSFGIFHRPTDVPTGQYIPAQDFNPTEKINWHNPEKIPNFAFYISCFKTKEIRDSISMKVFKITKEKRKKIVQELKHKHRFVIMDSDTYREKFSFRLSGLNLFVGIGISAIVLILLTSILIVFTPLREYIPGYTQMDIIQQSYENARKVDSLETIIHQQMLQVGAIKALISGGEVSADIQTSAPLRYSA